MTVATPKKKRRSDILGTPCTCCKGYTAFPRPCALEGCDALIHCGDDDWIRLYVMHHNRIGIGELSLCTIEHALELLAELREQRGDAEPIKLPGCSLPGHIDELTALSKALASGAVQIEQEHTQMLNDAVRDAGVLLTAFHQHDAYTRARAAQQARESLAYWRGVQRGIQDVAIAVLGERFPLHKLQVDMLDQIEAPQDADPQVPR